MCTCLSGVMYPTSSALFLLISCQFVYCTTGDPVLFLPPFEVRTVADGRPTTAGFDGRIQNRNIQSHMQAQMGPQAVMPQTFQQPVIPQTAQQPSIPQMPQQSMITTTTLKPKMEETPIAAKNFTFNDLLSALNEIEEKKETHDETRAAEHVSGRYPYDYQPSPYGYSRPNPYGSGSYDYQPPAAYVHPTAVHPVHHSSHAVSTPSKDAIGNLVKPVASKVANKLGGIISVVLALLTGTAPNDIEIKGFKEILINGIIKPLFVAKGGIKSLINKLTIPVISLLLINLEVLITIWWMWEDCPDNAPPPYSYPKPSYGYNSYR